MKMNMNEWVESVKASDRKKAIPVLSFPCISLLDCTVNQLTHDSSLQAKGMLEIARRCDAGAAVSFMDLSVEAEAFGSTIRNFDDEVPTVIGTIIEDPEEVADIEVPEVGAGRTSLYIEAITKVANEITDRPVFAGVIGPYSLAGRLMGMTELMINCYEEDEAVHELLGKCSQFIEQYILAFKNAGANGVVIAEPAAGLISPQLMDEFSAEYLKKIVENVQDENFIVVYHNCGNVVNRMTAECAKIGAKAYHFGNACDMLEMIEKMPSDVLVMGNVDPAGTLRNGTPDKVREETLGIMEKCCQYPNFVISSGCDIPPATPWENLDAFFAAAEEYYNK